MPVAGTHQRGEGATRSSRRWRMGDAHISTTAAIVNGQRFLQAYKTSLCSHSESHLPGLPPVRGRAPGCPPSLPSLPTLPPPPSTQTQAAGRAESLGRPSPPPPGSSAAPPFACCCDHANSSPATPPVGHPQTSTKQPETDPPKDPGGCLLHPFPNPRGRTRQSGGDLLPPSQQLLRAKCASCCASPTTTASEKRPPRQPPKPAAPPPAPAPQA